MSEVWPGLEVDQIRVDYRLELSIRHDSIRQRDHEVFLSVALQDGDVLVAASCLLGRKTEKESHSRLNSQGCPTCDKKSQGKNLVRCKDESHFASCHDHSAYLTCSCKLK